MRAVSFVERLQFDFKGNISKNGIVLGDVDNDNANELVAANILGGLVVFKGQQCSPWAYAEDLGMITFVLIGPILNDNTNYLICISSEGWCHIFLVNDENVTLKDGKRKLLPFHTQRIPANAKEAILADIDQDGCMELILGLTDRVVRTYRWADLSNHGTTTSDPKGKLVGIHKWEFANQIGSISINSTPEGKSSILVAQPGGTYIRLQCTGSLSDSDDEGEKNSSFITKLTPEYHGLASSRMRNPNISSEIMGGIKGVTGKGEPTSSLLAVATLDGTLMLVDGDEIIWSLQVDYQLFALTKLDLTGDSLDEVVACAWDGQTYIVNQQRQSVRFQFEEHVCSFTAGVYNLDSETSTSCFVYATFSNRIYLYHNITLSSIKTRSFRDILEKNEDVQKILANLNIPIGSDQERELYQWCLYGLPAVQTPKKETQDNNDT